MKHAESVIGLKLFSRKGGRFTPTKEAGDIFSQINGVYDKVEDLHFIVNRLKMGTEAELKIGSAPSISNVMMPLAIADVRRRYPDLLIEIDILKIEDTGDYLLLGKGEAVAMSSKFEHPMLEFEPLATGQLKCIVPAGHTLSSRSRVSPTEMAKYPMIGIDPNDPYGRIMASVFAGAALSYDIKIHARFGTTLCALVTNGLGIAIIDEFTLAGGNWPGICSIDIDGPATFQTYIVTRKDAALSSYCETFINRLRDHMQRQAGAPTTENAKQRRLRN